MMIEQFYRIIIWTSADGTAQVWSDGEQFFVTYRSGIALETLVTVGYASPNHALGESDKYTEHLFHLNGEIITYDEAVEWLAAEITKVVDGLIWEKGNADHNRKTFFALVEKVNWLYNDILG